MPVDTFLNPQQPVTLDLSRSQALDREGTRVPDVATVTLDLSRSQTLGRKSTSVPDKTPVTLGGTGFEDVATQAEGTNAPVRERSDETLSNAFERGVRAAKKAEKISGPQQLFSFHDVLPAYVDPSKPAISRYGLNLPAAAYDVAKEKLEKLGLRLDEAADETNRDKRDTWINAIKVTLAQGWRNAHGLAEALGRQFLPHEGAQLGEWALGAAVPARLSERVLQQAAEEAAGKVINVKPISVTETTVAPITRRLPGGEGSAIVPKVAEETTEAVLNVAPLKDVAPHRASARLADELTKLGATPVAASPWHEFNVVGEPWHSNLVAILRQKLPGRSFAAQDLQNIVDSGTLPAVEIEATGLRAWSAQQTGVVATKQLADFLGKNLFYPRVVETTEPSYTQYTLPGERSDSKNILLTLPQESVDRLGGTAGEPVTNPHFDAPNVVAHLRVDRRVNDDRLTSLHVNEVQSDWAFAQRKREEKTLLKWLSTTADATELARYATDEDFHVRMVVAKNTATPPEQLAALASDKKLFVREAVAQNVATPPEQLAELAQHKNLEVRAVVAENTATPPETLAALAHDDAFYVRANVAKNTTTPPKTLAELARDDDFHTRANVAKNIATPPETLIALVNDKNIFILEVVAKNPAMPPATLAALARDENPDIRAAVAQNAATPPEQLAALANDSYRVRIVVAQNAATPLETLAALARDKDPDVHAAVARNAATPPEQLAALANDKNIFVLEAVAKNTATPPATLAALAHNENTIVRGAIARNVATPPEQLAALARDENFTIRWIVAQNAATPTETLAALARDENYDVHAAVARNVATPMGVLTRLAETGDAHIRDQVARHPNAPPSLKREQTAAKNPFVKRWPELTMKEALRQAVVQDLSRVTWSTGASVHGYVQMGEDEATNLYDRTLPNVVKDYVAPWGGTVKQVKLKNGQPVWAVDIPPELRRRIQEGQPTFGALRREATLKKLRGETPLKAPTLDRGEEPLKDIGAALNLATYVRRAGGVGGRGLHIVDQLLEETNQKPLTRVTENGLAVGVRLPQDLYLYHSTTPAAVQNIMKDGLTPKSMDLGEKDKSTNLGPRALAEGFAELEIGEREVLLKVRLPKGTRIYRDDFPNDPTHVRIFDALPAENVQIIKGGQQVAAKLATESPLKDIAPHRASERLADELTKLGATPVAASPWHEFNVVGEPWHSNLVAILRQKLPGRSFVAQDLQNIVNSGTLPAAEVEATGLRAWSAQQTGVVATKQLADFLGKNLFYPRVVETTKPSYTWVTLPGKRSSSKNVLLTLPQESVDRLGGIVGKPVTNPHFDAPNVVAHLRVDRRVNDDRLTSLHVNEVQSDWALEQRAREEKTLLKWLSTTADATELARAAADDDFRIRIAVAKNPALPPATFAALANDKNLAVRLTVAKNPTTPPEQLATLAHNENLTIREAVARNAATPPATLAALASDENLKILQRAMAENTAESLAMFAGLAQEKYFNIYLALAQNTATPPATLAALARHKNFNIRQVVAENTATPPATLAALARDEDLNIRLAVAENTATPPATLAALANHKSLEIRQIVAENVATPPATLAVMARSKNFIILDALAQNTATPPKALAALARSNDTEVRTAVAQNTATAPATLAALVHDKNSSIRVIAAENAATPPATLAALVRNENSGVRAAVAQNVATPPEQFAVLARDKKLSVRKAVAQNAATPPEQLAALANDENFNVRGFVAQNAATPPEQLAALANDKNITVRMTVAQNAATPPEQLAALANDKNPTVRAAVAQNAATPTEVLAQLAATGDAHVRDLVARHPNAPPGLKREQTAAKNPFVKRWPELTMKEALRQAVAQDLSRVTWSTGASVHGYVQMGEDEAVNLYDRTLPNVVKDYVAPWGGTVKQVKLKNGQPVWAVDIPPELRRRIQEGQPTFGALRREATLKKLRGETPLKDINLGPGRIVPPETIARKFPPALLKIAADLNISDIYLANQVDNAYGLNVGYGWYQNLVNDYMRDGQSQTMAEKQARYWVKVAVSDIKRITPEQAEQLTEHIIQNRKTIVVLSPSASKGTSVHEVMHSLLHHEIKEIPITVSPQHIQQLFADVIGGDQRFKQIQRDVKKGGSAATWLSRGPEYFTEVMTQYFTKNLKEDSPSAQLAEALLRTSKTPWIQKLVGLSLTLALGIKLNDAVERRLVVAKKPRVASREPFPYPGYRYVQNGQGQARTALAALE